MNKDLLKKYHTECMKRKGICGVQFANKIYHKEKCPMLIEDAELLDDDMPFNCLIMLHAKTLKAYLEERKKGNEEKAIKLMQDYLKVERKIIAKIHETDKNINLD